MKKTVSLLLALVMCLAISAGAAEPPPMSDYTGVLTFLNLTPEEFGRWSVLFNYLGTSLIQEGYVRSELNLSTGDPEATLSIPYYPVKFYDNLDSMVNGLLVGEIYSFDIYSSVAKYICAQNDQLVQVNDYDTEKERTPFVDAVLNRFANGFSFMMMQEREALRDEFNGVIAEMKQDGTLDALIKTYIDDLANGQEPSAIVPETFDGAETIRVAVTGSLPPMDYVAADNTPAGFNTAVMAEIGKRLQKNIQMVQVDPNARALALATGQVDVVFWVRADSQGTYFADMDETEYAAYKEDLESKFTEEEKKAMEIMEEIPRTVEGERDIPDGTVITEPYYTDIAVSVMARPLYDFFLSMMNAQ